MKTKAILSFLLAAAHVAIMMWYYTHDQMWAVDNKALASFMFFGISFFIVGLNMFIGASNVQFPIQTEISKFHSVFIMLLGTIYALHYSGLMITTNKERLFMICAGVLLIFVIVVVSAWRHGFFKKETYDY